MVMIIQCEPIRGTHIQSCDAKIQKQEHRVSLFIRDVKTSILVIDFITMFSRSDQIRRKFIGFIIKQKKVDKIILSWIFTTLSDSLQKRLVIARPNSAKEAWDFIGDLVKENKRTRTSILKTELRSIKLGDLSMEVYFQKIESIMTILASLDSPASDDDVVHYVIDGLPEKYNQVCGYMHYQNTFLDFKTVRSLLITEEMRLKSKSLVSPVDSSSSSPMVLLTESGTSRRPSNPQSGNSMDALLVKLLDKLGVHDNGKNKDSKTTPTPTNLVAYTKTDFLTRRVLFRCDSTRDLYPVTTPSPIPHAFLVSQHTWHQRLGHPGSEVLRHLVSSKSISCNKEKPLVLCHACQLGKHVRLPFVSSNTMPLQMKFPILAYLVKPRTIISYALLVAYVIPMSTPHKNLNPGPLRPYFKDMPPTIVGTAISI
ncbi:ribonuclease H-like domain-containing protein [Tanacetum coccineum]